MKEQDKAEFAILMGEMGVAFKTDVDKPTMAVYFNRLQSFTMYQVRRAIDNIISHDDRFPVFSRVRAMASAVKPAPPNPNRHVSLIEEVAPSNDLPRTKEEFFAAMKKLNEKVTVRR